jgi:chromosome segregation ATPase
VCELTTELERIKILEGKISHVVEYINKIVSENEKLKTQIKELKVENKNYMEEAKRLESLDDSIKKYEKDREVIKEKIETIIEQIDKIGV